MCVNPPAGRMTVANGAWNSVECRADGVARGEMTRLRVILSGRSHPGDSLSGLTPRRSTAHHRPHSFLRGRMTK